MLRRVCLGPYGLLPHRHTRSEGKIHMHPYPWHDHDHEAHEVAFGHIRVVPARGITHLCVGKGVVKVRVGGCTSPAILPFIRMP